jgi:hippurate hydrolase
MDLLADAEAMSDDLIALRRRLHAIPEIGLDLPATQAEVLAALDGLGLEVSTGAALSSVTAVLRGGRRERQEGDGAGLAPAVLLRGDMDALPVVEHSGVPYAPAADGPHAANMHACGHDLHVAGLVGAARLLAAHRDQVAGDVVFMFQPGEEGWDGAGHMIAEGVLDAAGPRVTAAYGLHVLSSILPPGGVAARPGPLMSASAGLSVRVLGAGGHGSMPHRAKDPIAVAAEMVTALQTVVTRQFDVFDPIVVTVGMFHGGTRRNVIPDDAVFEATVRTFSPEASARAEAACTRVCRDIAAAHGLTAEVDFHHEYPVTVNDPGEFEFAADTVRDLFGDARFATMPHPMSGSEDFSRVLDAVPGAFLFVGAVAGDPNTAPSNHSPLAAFDDSIVPAGAALLAELAMRRLAS